MGGLLRSCALALLGAIFVSPVLAEEAETPLRVYGNTSTFEFAPVLLAVDRLYPGKATVTNGGVPDLFKEGGADVATNAETQALRTSVDNPSLRIIFTVSEGLYRIVARRSSGISKLEDLRGKRIATIPNTSSAFHLHKMLKTVGMTESDVTVVRMFPLQKMPPALKSGEVDAITIWEPEIQIAQELIGDDAIELGGRGVYRELFNLNTTAENLANPVKRRQIVAFVRALIEASRQIRENPEVAWPLVAKSSGYDEGIISRAWHHHAFAGGLAYDLLDVLEEEEVWVAKERNRKPRTRAELATLIDTSVLREALAQDAAPEPTDKGPATARLARLAANVENAEAIRAVKRLQHAYGHYTEFGLWNDVADLFATNAVLQLGRVTVTGRENIRKYFLNEVGRGQLGLAPGRLHTELFLSPVVTLSADGRLAKGRWHSVSMLGEFGKSASWAGGIYENEYVQEEGKWRIAKLHHFPQYAGPYDTGWRNLKEETPETVAPVPYHYTPASAGTPVPPSPQIEDVSSNASTTQLARKAVDLERRARRLADEAEVQNLQHAFGFYLDRRMWDDIVDLFADDGTFEMSQMGVYQGKASIRRLLESFGPQGLREGELNDQLQLQTLVTVSEDGQTARARGTQLSMTGIHGGSAHWATGTYENEYVKQDGVWKIKSVHIYSRMRTNYDQGWAISAEPAQGTDDKVPADRPPTERYQNYPHVYIPAFHYVHPVTGKPPQYPKDMRAARAPMRAEKSKRSVPRANQEFESTLAEAERLLNVAVAYDGTENVVNAYGYYIDEFLWTETGDLFSTDGWKELSYIGTYVGRDRVRDSMIKRYGNKGRRANSLAIHQKTQPVIHVAPDGRSAKVRTRLFQINSALDAEGSYIAGIYENRTVLENGVWKIQAMDLDYTWTASYRKGWTRIEAGAQRRYAPPSQFSQDYPPDRPLRGWHFAPFPQVPDLAFHYRNPVSGRVPPALLLE